MRTFPANFAAEKNRKTGAAPVWILKCPFTSGIIYLSDTAFAVPGWNGGITTMPWIREWGRIDEDISEDMTLTRVSDFFLKVLIDPVASPNMETILGNVVNSIETTDIELYLWFRGLNAASDPPQKIWAGNIIDYRISDELTCEVDLVDNSVKLDRYVGTLLDRDLYPRMEPEDVGKVGNIVMGDCDNVPCHCILAGGAATLTNDITASSPGNGGILYVDDSTQFPASGAFYVQVGDEIIACAGGGGSTYLRCASSGARGAQSTTAAAHSAGDPAVEIPSAYAYLVADNDRTITDNGVVVVDNVRVDGVLVTDGVTVLTSGGSYANNKTVVTLTHGPVDPNPESLSPRGATISNAADPAYSIDGSTATSCNMTALNQYLQVEYPASPNKGSVVTQQIDVLLSVPSTMTLTVTTGWTPATVTNTGGSVTRAFTKTGGVRSDPIRFTVSSFSSGTASIYEVGDKHVTAYRIHSGGSSAAKIRVGRSVTVHAVTALPGTAHAPDKVIGRFLNTYAGIAPGDFATDGAAQFSAKGYKLAVVINEYRTLRSWLALMAFQSRSYFRFSGGKACLLYRPDSVSTVKTVASNMVRMGSGFRTTLRTERSPLDEVINRINLKYNRDWSKSGGDAYRGISKGSDAASIARYGEKQKAGLFIFDFVKLKAMADDLRDFYLARYKDRKRRFAMEVFLDNAELEFADVVSLEPAGNVPCEVEKVNIEPGSGMSMRNDRIHLAVKEY